MGQVEKVLISDMKMSKTADQIITYALGSCVGICLYDPILKYGAMIHVMFPECKQDVVDNPFKYADKGIEETLRQMRAKGSNLRSITAKIAGGASVLKTGVNRKFQNIGHNNVIKTRETLKKFSIRLVAEDVLLNHGRTMVFDPKTGAVTVKSYSCDDIKL